MSYRTPRTAWRRADAGDLSGRVLAIPTLAVLPQFGGSRAPGIGFAIPGDTVGRVADGLIAQGQA